MRWVGDKRLTARSLELLLSQLTSAFVSGSIAALVLIYAFWETSDHIVSLLWAVAYAAVACYRTYLRKAYFTCGEEQRDASRWFKKLGISIFITGVLWGGFLLYLASFAEGVSAAILMANLAFLLAVAVTAYAVSLPVFIMFSSPIVIPSVLFLMLSREQGNWLLAAVFLGWYLFMVSAARRFGEFAMRALGYEYENRELVGELEEQNRRAEVLAQELIVLSNTDSLTGLYNRRYFDERLRSEIARSQRSETPLSLILGDVDYFKIYNDTLGHIEGDKCLKRIAEILIDSVRDGTDIVARYGGEEFAIVLTSTGIHQAKVFAERLRRAIFQSAMPHPRSSAGPYVTLSMGISTLVENEQEVMEDLIERADRALYRAKECGRDQVQLQEPS